MGKRTISQAIIQRLNEKYTLIKKDIEYPILKKKGMTFNLEVYDISNIGIISILKMKALFGLMKMETVTFTVNNKDVPLYNIDYIKALKNETILIEFYDDIIDTIDPNFFFDIKKLKEEYSQFLDYQTEPNWYDDIIYDETIRKTGKKCHQAFEALAIKSLDSFINKLDEFESCDIKLKNEKILEFANNLYTKGGPAVNAFKELFGEKITKKVVIEYMYGQK